MARKPVRRPTPEQLARRRKTIIWLICLGLVVLVLLVPLVLYARLHGGPALPAEIQKRLASEHAQTPPTAIPSGTPSLRQQLAQVEYAGRTGDSQPRTLYVSEADLADILAGSLKTDPRIRDVRAYFGDGKAYAVATGDWHGRELTITVTAEPVIVNGGVQFGVESVKLGSMAAPSIIADKVRQQVVKNADKLSPQRTGLSVERIEISNGVAVLYGRAVPKTR